MLRGRGGHAGLRHRVIPHPVPWNLTRDQTRVLLAVVRRPARSCIVTGGAAEAIIDLALALLPDAVQLHAETLQDTAHVVQALVPRGIRVIKTLPMSAEDRLAQLGQRDPALLGAAGAGGASAILVDSPARRPAQAAQVSRWIWTSTAGCRLPLLCRSSWPAG